MSRNFILTLAIIATSSFTVGAEEPNQNPNAAKDRGWQSHTEYHAALRRKLLEDGERKTVERVDAAVTELFKAKKWEQLWALTQNGTDRESPASWYAAATIGTFGEKAKGLLPFMNKSIAGMLPKREDSWPLSARPYVGYFVYDIYASIGRPAIPYLISQLGPTLYVESRDGDLKLTEQSWRARRNDDIYICYEWDNMMAARTINAIANGKPFVFGTNRHLIDPDTPLNNRLIFDTQGTKKLCRALLRKLMKEKDVYIRLQSAYVALQDPGLWEDAVRCFARLGVDAWTTIVGDRK